MAEITLMCGLAGCGKSTYARKLATRTNAVIISRDSLREMVAGTYQQYQKIVFASNDKKFSRQVEGLVSDMAESCMTIALQQGHNVIIDETNITKKRRAYWINVASVACPNITINCVWLQTSESVCIERRLKDTHDCEANWVAIVKSMARAWQPPNTMQERIDNIKII